MLSCCYFGLSSLMPLEYGSRRNISRIIIYSRNDSAKTTFYIQEQQVYQQPKKENLWLACDNFLFFGVFCKLVYITSILLSIIWDSIVLLEISIFELKDVIFCSRSALLTSAFSTNIGRSVE